MNHLSEKKLSVASLQDSCGRKISYLRLSITDRCNLRCHYCVPAGGMQKLQHSGILSFVELESLAKTVIALGIEKIRITGGEPLVRPGAVEFLDRLGHLPGLRHLVLTTNGVLLPSLAADLATAGVRSLNISLDSLRPETFANIAGIQGLQRVISGIEAALKTDMMVKLNMVPMRGINDSEIFDMVKYACEHRISLRFIEYMPVYRAANWQKMVIPGAEILRRLRQQFELTPLPHLPLAGPAQYFKISDQETKVGIIAPVFDHICSDCNRIRITAAGRIRSCLFSDEEIALRPFLQEGRQQELITAFRKVIDNKPAGHKLLNSDHGFSAFPMAAVGG